MKSIMMAWLVGEGIVVYRSVKKNKRPPLPADILGVSGLFVILGLLSDPQPQLAGLLAWGLDAAAFVALFTKPPTPYPNTPLGKTMQQYFPQTSSAPKAPTSPAVHYVYA